MTQSSALQRAVAKYDKANIKGLFIKLHKEKDKDIIDKLESVKSKQGYIKHLIRKDIECKDYAVCPKCGEYNYKPPLNIRKKIGETVITEKHIYYSMVKYKCICCGEIWSERWDA